MLSTKISDARQGMKRGQRNTLITNLLTQTTHERNHTTRRENAWIIIYYSSKSSHISSYKAFPVTNKYIQNSIRIVLQHERIPPSGPIFYLFELPLKIKITTLYIQQVTKTSRPSDPSLEKEMTRSRSTRFLMIDTNINSVTEIQFASRPQQNSK